MTMEGQVPFLKQIAKALAVQFGSQCEVTVHDLTQDSDSTIIAIENGHISGRKIGDGASQIVLRALKSKDNIEDSYGYLTRTQDGRLLKSSSVYLRDADNRAVALLGINYDITDITHANSILNQFVSTAQDKQQQNGIDEIFSNVNDLLDMLIEESVEHVGKPVALMNKEDKVKAIRYLEKKGAFLIKKSGDKVTKFYDISKYTLYNYLDSETD
jgi:predicted transcriptional regulator YheO